MWENKKAPKKCMEHKNILKNVWEIVKKSSKKCEIEGLVWYNGYVKLKKRTFYKQVKTSRKK